MNKIKIKGWSFFQIEGRDISVCVRVRPLMSHEQNSGIFESVVAEHPFVHTLEPKFDVKGNAKAVRYNLISYTFFAQSVMKT